MPIYELIPNKERSYAHHYYNNLAEPRLLRGK